MQKKILFLLLTLGCLLCGWASQAQNQNNCNLPAPTNIQFSQPNSTTLHVTWNPVPGAVAFLVTLENLTNNAQTTQAAITVPTAYDFTVIPGNIYRFRGRAQCSNGSFSTSFGEGFRRADYIVIDLIVDRGNCTPSGSPVVVMQPNGPPYNNLTSGNLYAAVFSHPSLPAPTKFSFQHINSKFKFQGLGTPAPQNEVLQGQIIGALGDYGFPPMDASEVKASYPGAIEMHISFASPNEIHFKGTMGSTLTIYPSCSGGFSPGSNEGDDPIIPTIDPVAQTALRNIQVINPFDSDLTLLFPEHPEQPVNAQLCDVSGRVHLQKTIQPAEVGANQYTLPTANLQPGMYFLRLETAPGVFSTHKVVKCEQR